MKILVTGFQRSGTTLLKDLIWKHPDVAHMFHEVALLKFSKKHLLTANFLPDKKIKNNYQGVMPYQFKVNFSLKKGTWGEKIPYWGPKVYKGYNKFVTRYCRQWNKYFGDKARIIHIIRHPMDVAISTKNRGFTKGITRPIKVYKTTMPQVLNLMQDIDNIKHVQFENLVTNPEKTLREIYQFCGLRHGDKILHRIIHNKNIFRFKTINKKRAYNFKRMNVNIRKYNLRQVLILLNQVDGINFPLPGV